MKITVLDKASLGEDTPFAPLAALGELITYDATSKEEAIKHIADSDVIVINKVKITDEVLSRVPRLKLICVFATGYDNVDLDAARRYGVGVCNVPAYSTSSVTLFTLSTVLALVSHLTEYREFVKSGSYTAAGLPNRLTPVFHEVDGMKWGIVGYGNIGMAVGEVARAMGAELLVCKRAPTEGVRCVDIDTLCREADIITLHCPLNSETRGLINRERLSLMKPTAVLVNEARGAVLDENAVAEAVLNKQIAAFGCDVYSTEPFGEPHPYTKIMHLNNVILTPHAAWAAYEARVRCVNTIKENITSYVNGGKLNRID
ncbi:MAG: hydroxyacid dehydrogenase [Clostridia bacterium]|nr:hydroxyacid dehydrogenase [Clostridia bacterium]